jgi:hypothetical protein
MEAAIYVDVVNDDCSAGAQAFPSTVNFEANIALTVQAVVNEKINLPELGQYAREASPARA